MHVREKSLVKHFAVSCTANNLLETKYTRVFATSMLTNEYFHIYLY